MNSTIEEQQQTISHLRQELQNALDECKRLRKCNTPQSAPWDPFEYPRIAAEISRLNAENTILRGIAAKIMPCQHCGVNEISKCPSGFPGCALADDLMAAEELHGEHLRTQLEQRTKERDELDSKLTHTLTSLKVGTLPYWQSKHDKLVIELFKLESEAAAMRELLGRIDVVYHGILPASIYPRIKEALSGTTAGTRILARLEALEGVAENYLRVYESGHFAMAFKSALEAGK